MTIPKEIDYRMSSMPIIDARVAPRLSVPAAGRSLVRAAEERARHFRQAVSILESSLRSTEANQRYLSICTPRWMFTSGFALEESIEARASRFLANIWLAAACCGGLDANATLSEAETWFLGNDVELFEQISSLIPDEFANAAVSHLAKLASDEHLLELLPYILDPFGPASRLDVMRDPSNLSARNAKKEGGVFYTPSDVADYMVEHTLQSIGISRTARWLDPSCGTGVFLVSVLRACGELSGCNKLDFALENLFGIDVSCQSIESCAFVLFHHCSSDAEDLAISPWRVWHALRLNLAAADSLRIRPVKQCQEAGYHASACSRDEIRRDLLNGGRITQPVVHSSCNSSFSLFSQNDDINLGDVFPEVASGVDVLVGNPPYASLGFREDASLLAQSYQSSQGVRFSTSGNAYTFFVEMMWRLTKETCSASALVVPLSIAYHQGKQYSNCRRAMSLNGGQWQFAFFDREPHALFGEEAKTRNAILFRLEAPGQPPRGTIATVQTGPLRKWTSRMRANLFRTMNFTPIGSVGLTSGLPKLDGELQGKMYSTLTKRIIRLRSMPSHSGTCLPCDACNSRNENRIYVATTAYNFLNVFRGFSVDDKQLKILSQNRVHYYDFANRSESSLAFAIVSSRLTYWLWHAECDGFHVSKSFIDNLPFDSSSFSTVKAAELSSLGEELWHAVQLFRIESKNKGKLTIAFRPLGCELIREQIDQILIESSGLNAECSEELRDFVFRTVVVDHTDERRMHLTNVFHGTTRSCSNDQENE